MKKFPILIALSLLAWSVAPSLGTPLLRYEFDEAGSTQSSTGSSSLALTVLNYDNIATNYITNTPVQRAGAKNGNALNLTSSNVDSGVPSDKTARGGAQAFLSNSNAAFLRGDLGSFTISAWVLNAQPRDAVSVDRRIFSLRNAAGDQIVDFRLYNPTGTKNILYLGLTGSEGSKTLTAPSVTVPGNNQEWFFISITYDASTGLVNFYAGGEGGTLSTASASNVGVAGVNTLLTNATLLGVGNVGYQHARRLDGYLSDVRFYDEALSAEEIGNLYAIPEPGTAMILGAGVLIVCLRRWKGLGQ